MGKWVPIKGYEGLYEISESGVVKSLPRIKKDSFGGEYTTKPRILKVSITKKGYVRVKLTDSNGCSKEYFLHRLVIQAFKETIPDSVVNHLDGNKQNNHFSNLEWVTHQENIKHAVKKGLFHKGERTGSSVLTEEDVRWIRSTYEWHSKENNANALAKKLNVSKSTVRGVIDNRTWTHVV
jgi:hypothetical protein